MYARYTLSQLAIFLVMCCALLACVTTAQAESDTKENGYRITKFDTQASDKSITVTIGGDSIPAYTVSERFGPFRAVVDIANASFQLDGKDKGVQPELAKNDFIKLAISSVNDQQPAITRFEFTIADSHTYTVNRSDNNIIIKFDPSTNSSSQSTANSAIPAISDIAITPGQIETVVSIKTTKTIKDYKTEKILGGKDKPARMFIDFANISIDRLVKEKEVGTSLARIRVAPRGTGARIVFDSSGPEIFNYTIKPTDSSIDIVIKEPEGLVLDKKSVKKSAGTGAAEVTDATLDALIESTSSQVSKKTKESGKKGGLEDRTAVVNDSFSMSGYNKEKISVDFYKIDIHNVFRLLREVSRENIIVDEEVKGTLTVSLTDVPWDFALDIILNLMDLRKEQRFNTIVIYPKKKEFVWPERRDDNLSVQADANALKKEELEIEQKVNLPEEVLKAQDLIRKALIAEKNKDFEEAVKLYESAATLWPKNPSIYNRLSAIYLAELKVNAKAVHFAKENLKVNPNDTKAALYAAIGSANMQRNAEASEYFNMSIAGKPPLKEALASYASFTENNQQYEASLKILEKYNAQYGETLNTMVAKARIYDKLGKTDQAVTQYRAILASGFAIQADLKNYIQGRIAASQ